MWIKIRLNANQIKETSSKTSDLIKLPGQDKSFWLSRKLIRGNGGWYSTISVNEDYFYYTDKKTQMTGIEIADFFENQIINESDEKNIPEEKIAINEIALAELTE